MLLLLMLFYMVFINGDWSLCGESAVRCLAYVCIVHYTWRRTRRLEQHKRILSSACGRGLENLRGCCSFLATQTERRWGNSPLYLVSVLLSCVFKLWSRSSVHWLPHSALAHTHTHQIDAKMFVTRALSLASRHLAAAEIAFVKCMSVIHIWRSWCWLDLMRAHTCARARERIFTDQDKPIWPTTMFLCAYLEPTNYYRDKLPLCYRECYLNEMPHCWLLF